MGWLDDVGNAVSNAAGAVAGAVGKVVEVQVAIATAPTKILIDTAASITASATFGHSK